MHVEVVEFGSANCRWDLVESYLRHRRNVFIGQKRWSLVSYGALEFDQYDVLPAAVYVVAHFGGKVIGGALLLRCDTRIGTGPAVYSYMIRDAVRGVISLPRDVCWDEPPDDAENWELTRLLTVRPSMAVVKSILDSANAYLARHKAHRCLFLGPEGQTRRLLVASADNLERVGRPGKLDDLARQTCIRDTNMRGDEAWPQIEGAALHRVHVSGPYLVNSARIARDLAVEGEGIALCHDYMVQADLAQGRLHHVLPQVCGPQLDIHAVYIGQRRLARRTRALLDFLSPEMKSSPETA